MKSPLSSLEFDSPPESLRSVPDWGKGGDFPYYQPRSRVDPYGPLRNYRPAGGDVKAAGFDGRLPTATAKKTACS